MTIVAMRLIASGMLIAGCFWLASTFGFVSVPRNVTLMCQGAFYLLWVVSLVMAWRTRNRRPQKEPSPAQSAVAVIIATGAVAVGETARHANEPSDYAVPAFVAILAALLAVIAFRFASKNRDSIGEARFDTTGNSSWPSAPRTRSADRR